MATDLLNPDGKARTDPYRSRTFLIRRGVVVALILVVVTLAVALRHTRHSGVVRPSPETVVNQAIWDRLLQRYVDDDGMVDYRGLAADGRGNLEQYLAELAQADPEATSRQDQLAFWINAYNAGIIAGILHGYSPETALSRAQLFRWYSFAVAGRQRTPDQIENDILRSRFHEPRIHFALVCGATSCPKLRREAYRGDRLDEQLNDQARRFINDPSRNRIDPVSGEIELSSIFEWFAPDFVAAQGSVAGFVARYVTPPDQAETLRQHGERVQFFEYDWALNTQRDGEPCSRLASCPLHGSQVQVAPKS